MISLEHNHHAKSSIKFFETDDILKQVGFAGNETFMDAGCGDGHIAVRALEEFIPDGKAYAVDVYSPCIENLKDYAEKNSIDNLIAIEADVGERISGVEDGSVDVILMVNVVHGFKASENMEEVIGEMSKLLKVGGKFAIVDFNPIEWSVGPPIEIKCSPMELEEIFTKFNFKLTYLNEEMGLDEDGKRSHYLIIFEKEQM